MRCAVLRSLHGPVQLPGGGGRPVVLLAICRNNYFYIKYSSSGVKYKISMDFHDQTQYCCRNITHRAGQLRSLPHNPHCTNFPANFSVDKYDKEKKFFFNAEPASGVSRTSTEPGRHLVFIWDMTVSILKGLDSNTCGAGEPVPISLWEPPHPSPAGLLQHQGPPFVNTLIWVRWSLPSLASRAALAC